MIRSLKRDAFTHLWMLFDKHMNLHHAASHALRSLMRLSIKVFECGCQVWATSSLTYDSSKITPTHVLHLGFLKRLLGVKRGTNTHCVLRKTGQLPIFFFWFRCIIRFWNSLHSSNNPFLEKVVRSDLLIAKWYLDLPGSARNPKSQQFFNAIQSRESINLKQFELTLHEHIIGSWRELDNLTPRDNHHSSRTMRTYHTHFAVPLGIAPGWWLFGPKIAS